MKILSIDPGTDNFGFAAQVFTRKAVTLIRCGMLDETIKEVKESEELFVDAKAFDARFLWLLKKSGATRLGAERYIPRRQGLANESINMMLGAAVVACTRRDIRCSLFLAATWKIRLKKVLVLETLYLMCKPVPDHVVDAVFIGLFAAEKLGLYSLDKLKSTRQQQLLCKMINSKYLDLRTKPKRVPKRRATTRKRKSRAKS